MLVCLYSGANFVSLHVRKIHKQGIYSSFFPIKDCNFTHGIIEKMASIPVTGRGTDVGERGFLENGTELHGTKKHLILLWRKIRATTKNNKENTLAYRQQVCRPH